MRGRFAISNGLVPALQTLIGGTELGILSGGIGEHKRSRHRSSSAHNDFIKQQVSRPVWGWACRVSSFGRDEVRKRLQHMLGANKSARISWEMGFKLREKIFRTDTAHSVLCSVASTIICYMKAYWRGAWQ
jgi:hypothetical protein